MQHAAHEHASAGFDVLAYALERTGRPLVCLRSQLPLIRAGAPTEWVHVAYEGEWHGYHGDTSFKFTRERFEEAVANHERQRNAAKLDFDHETDFAPPGSSVPARGWVHRLEIRDQNGIAHLWALVEFGAEAVRKNRDGGYRFCSGVFDFNAKDRVTGEPIGLYMPRLSLTDDPFLDGQTPTILSRAAALALSNEEKMEASNAGVDKSELVSRIRKLEGDKVTPAQVAQLAQSMALLAEAMAGSSKSEPESEPDAPEEPAAMSAAPATPPAAPAAETPAEPVAAAADTPPDAPAADPAADEAGSLLEQAMASLGLDLPGLIEALKGLLGGAEMPAAVAPLSAKVKEQALLLSAHTTTIKTLSTRAETAEAEVKRYREAEADAAVSVLVESGRILDNGREDMRALYLSNRKAFDTLSAALPAHVPVGEHAAGQTPPTEATPAINEDDPFVKERRRILSNTWLAQRGGKAAVDEAIRRELAARKNNGVRV